MILTLASHRPTIASTSYCEKALHTTAGVRVNYTCCKILEDAKTEAGQG